MSRDTDTLEFYTSEEEYEAGSVTRRVEATWDDLYAEVADFRRRYSTLPTIVTLNGQRWRTYRPLDEVARTHEEHVRVHEAPDPRRESPMAQPGRPREGTDVLFGSDFARVVLAAPWQEGSGRKLPGSVALLRLYGDDVTFEEKPYAVTDLVEHPVNGVLFLSGTYDLTAAEAAEEFAHRAYRLEETG